MSHQVDRTRAAGRHGQVAMEFTITIGISIFILIVFIALVGREHAHLNDVREASLMTDYMSSIQNEFIVASLVKDGYVRSIYLPARLSGKDYTIENTANYITISYSGMQESLFIPSVVGNITKGHNLIEKRGGVVHIN